MHLLRFSFAFELFVIAATPAIWIWRCVLTMLIFVRGVKASSRILKEFRVVNLIK